MCHYPLGARMPYREAAFILSGLLPRQQRCNYSTIRNHTLLVGERINFGGPEHAVKATSDAVHWASVAIDGTYVRACPSEGAHRFQIVADRYAEPRRQATLFAFVQRFQPSKHRMAELWSALGCSELTHLRVLTDGDRGMSAIVRNSGPGTCGQVLDWLHIAMRVQSIRRSFGFSRWRAGYTKRATRSEVRNLESIRHRLWHGDIELGCEMLGRLAGRVEIVSASMCRGQVDWLETNLRQMRELCHYLQINKDKAVSYSAEHRAGQRVTTAPVEPTINHLINRRMNKRQQMSWS